MLKVKMNDDKDEEKQEDTPKGIGGWLLIPTIAFWLNGIIIFFMLIGSIALIEQDSSFYVPLSFFLAIFLAIIVYTIYLELKHKKLFKTFAIIYFVIWIILTIVSLSGAALGSIIWILYLCNSKRVKNTFIN